MAKQVTLILVLPLMMALEIPYQAGTLKINANFDEVYETFGDGTNLVSFVSYATTAGYSTNAGIASTSTYAQTARYVTSDIDINTSGVVTTSYADIGKITIQQPGELLRMVLLRLDLRSRCLGSNLIAWLGLELLSQHLNLKLHPSLHLDLHCGLLQRPGSFF